MLKSGDFGLLLLLLVVLGGVFRTAVRLAGLVVYADVPAAAAAAEVTAVQVLAAGRRRRRFRGRHRILRRQREQRFRGLGRVPDPAAVTVLRVMLPVVAVVVVVVPAAVLLMVIVIVVVVVVVVVVMVVMGPVRFLAFDVFQLHVNRVLLAADRRRLHVAVQILVAEPVAAERLGGQVVPRLDRLDGGRAAAVVPPVRGRRLRLDRVLSGRRLRRRHRVVVPV